MTNIIKSILITLALTLSIANAADNSIYVDQAGDRSTISVTQDGAGNVVRGIQGVGSGNTTPAIIRGDGNQVSISQIGSGNTLNFGVRTTEANGVNNGNNFTYSVTGNNATANIKSNNAGTATSASNNISITQTGNSANADIDVLGSANNITVTTAGGANNSITSRQNGDYNTQTVSMTGGGANSAIIKQGDESASTENNKGTITLASVGASNSFNLSQTGGGTNGHTMTLDFNGSSNTVTATQLGTAGDNVANIKSVGSTNSFTVYQNNR